MGSFMERVVKLLLEAMLGQQSLSFVTTQMQYTNSVFDGFTDAATASSTNIGKFYTVLMACGYGLLLIYWLIALLDDMKIRSVSPEWFVRHLMRLIISMMILSNALPAIIFIYQFGNAMVTQLSTGLAKNAGASGNVTDVQIPHAIAAVRIYIYNAILPLQLLSFAKLLLPWIMLMLIRVLIYAFLLARTLELVIRICFAPLALPRLYPGGRRSHAWAYTRRLLAISLQAFTICVCVWGGSILCQTFMSTNGSMAKIADELKKLDSSDDAAAADAYISSYAGASASSEYVGFNPYGSTPTTDDNDEENKAVAGDDKNTLKAVEKTGRAIYNDAFTLGNLSIVLGVYGSVMALIARSRSITEDIVMA